MIAVRHVPAFAAAFFLVSAIAGLVPVPAIAGERLRLRTGEVDLTNASQATSVLTLPNFEATPDEEAQSKTLRPEWIGTKEKRPSKKADARKIRHFIVQMNDRLSNEDFLNFRSLKVEIIRYIPDDAVVVAGTARTAQVLAKSSNRIRAIALYRPEWKLSPELGASSVFSGDPIVTSIVRLFPDQDVKDLLKHLKDSKVIVKAAQGRTAIVESKRSLLQAMASVDSVEWMEPAPTIELPQFRDEALSGHNVGSSGDETDLGGFESGTRLMKLEAAWARGHAGADQIVAVADNETSGKIKGAAPLASVLVQNLWPRTTENLNSLSKLQVMFGRAYAAGARVHANSWGGVSSYGIYDSMAQQVDEFTSANPDFLVLFAAGNGGEDADRDGRVDANSISSPATAKNALTVGASKNFVTVGGVQAKLSELKIGPSKWPVEPLASSRLSENEKGLAAFSSRGPTLDGRLKPEVVAPGTNILSTRSQHSNSEDLWGVYNARFGWSGGTSTSAPLVAGAAVLVREYLIKDRKIAWPSAALVKAVLMHTAEDLFPGQFGDIGVSRGQEIATPRPNNDEGYGRVDVDKATALASSLLVDERVGLGPGEIHLYPVNLAKATDLAVTMVYTDAPGAMAASKVLVNDLDIAILDASGKRFEISDRINNNEHLKFHLEAGAYQIEVRGVNVPISKQPYALIVSASK